MFNVIYLVSGGERPAPMRSDHQAYKIAFEEYGSYSAYPRSLLILLCTGGFQRA